MDKINLKEKFAQISDHWNPRIVGELNGQHVRLAKILGEFEWHSHAGEDELFLVVGGSMALDLRDRTIELGKGEAFIVPRGVEHRPRSDEECHILLFEPAATVNTGATPSERTRTDLEHI